MNHSPIRTAAVESQNLSWLVCDVTREERTVRNAHPDMIIWLTGISGSGNKRHLPRAGAGILRSRDATYVHDVGNIRDGLNSNLGFSPDDRVENLRRVAEVACLIVIAPFISPYFGDRRRARENALENVMDVIEVFVSAPLSVCEQCDPKGLYKKARAGEIQEFTGINSPYKIPETSECIVHTDVQNVEEFVATGIACVRPRLPATG